MGRKDPAPDLAAEIDALEAKVHARLEDFVAEDRARYPGLPDGTVRECLLKGERNIFHAVRRILREREAQQ